MRLVKPVFITVHDDDLEKGSLVFVQVVKDIAHICSDVTNLSLVVVDKVCRSTFTDEGAST